MKSSKKSSQNQSKNQSENQSKNISKQSSKKSIPIKNSNTSSLHSSQKNIRNKGKTRKSLLDTINQEQSPYLKELEKYKKILQDKIKENEMEQKKLPSNKKEKKESGTKDKKKERDIKTNEIENNWGMEEVNGLGDFNNNAKNNVKDKDNMCINFKGLDNNTLNRKNSRNDSEDMNKDYVENKFDSDGSTEQKVLSLTIPQSYERNEENYSQRKNRTIILDQAENKEFLIEVPNILNDKKKQKKLIDENNSPQIEPNFNQIIINDNINQKGDSNFEDQNLMDNNNFNENLFSENENINDNNLFNSNNNPMGSPQVLEEIDDKTNYDTIPKDSNNSNNIENKKKFGEEQERKEQQEGIIDQELLLQQEGIMQHEGIIHQEGLENQEEKGEGEGEQNRSNIKNSNKSEKKDYNKEETEEEKRKKYRENKLLRGFEKLKKFIKIKLLKDPFYNMKGTLDFYKRIKAVEKISDIFNESKKKLFSSVLNKIQEYNTRLFRGYWTKIEKVLNMKISKDGEEDNKDYQSKVFISEREVSPEKLMEENEEDDTLNMRHTVIFSGSIEKDKYINNINNKNNEMNDKKEDKKLKANLTKNLAKKENKTNVKEKGKEGNEKVKILRKFNSLGPTNFSSKEKNKYKKGK